MNNQPRKTEFVDWLIFISMVIVGLLEIFVKGSVLSGSLVLLLGCLGLSLLIGKVWMGRRIDQLSNRTQVD